MPKETTTQTAAGDMAAENAALKAKLAEIHAAKKQAEADESLIAEKMAKGLRREQAAAVLRRQRDYDEQKAKAAKQKAKG